MTTTKPCFGIGCALHAECSHYAAVETNKTEKPIGTCAVDALYPYFRMRADLIRPAKKETV